MTYIPIEGNSNFVRDPVSNAIVNVNLSEYNAYVEQRNIKTNESLKIRDIENQITDLKEDLNEIKILLRSFYEKT